MVEVSYNEYATEALKALEKGAFLSVTNGEQDNVMTVSWGTMGYIWRRPVLMVLVRYSRHTFEMLEESQEFTLSLPLEVDLKKALAKCGSLSGRDVDKFAETGITKGRATKVNAPVVEECELHYECKVVTRMPLTQEMVIPEIAENFYNKDNYHVLYYGEILGTYIKK
ncbi:MAG: flavin reductase [Epulopiscium sp. Nele67-Bin002]|nr:MAG: flavin reductase [Epulopiscium sp. Nuni2H_MBin001]OON92094.1 MAG: flavin reductase [Epulopiscium sp. Nele67-Bin002]OON92846.1 MAG: flavin reductase [Epulopiscium sp. Nele67-Bin001]